MLNYFNKNMTWRLLQWQVDKSQTTHFTDVRQCRDCAQIHGIKENHSCSHSQLELWPPRLSISHASK